jgi:hypothetical protein
MAAFCLRQLFSYLPYIFRSSTCNCTIYLETFAERERERREARAFFYRNLAQNHDHYCCYEASPFTGVRGVLMVIRVCAFLRKVSSH